MLRIVTGRFHPDLERAFVEEIRQLKSDDPLIPLTMVVPSEPLRRRLKYLLCVEHQCVLLEFSLLTFYQLARRLLEEGLNGAGASALPTVRSQFFFKELVHESLRATVGTAPGWSRLVEMPGAWAALWATLKDLKDANVDAERVLEAVPQMGLDGKSGDLTSLLNVLRLYQGMLDDQRRLHVIDPDDLANMAQSHVSSSPFLGRQRRILYYGFYDLTQVQLDLFQLVVHSYPTSLYFPLVPRDPAYLFAQKFYERYVHGLSQEPVLDTSQSEQAVTTPARSCRILNVTGRTDEITVVAKEILGLVEDRGYAFRDIGVVARTLSGYDTLIPHVFSQHGIPFTSSITRPLSSFPCVKAAMQLLDLRLWDFRRDHMMNLLSSPFFRLADLSSGTCPPQPDVWDLASRRLGITQGKETWQRLDRFQQDVESLTGNRNTDARSLGIPSEQIREAWAVITRLIEALSGLPETSTWHEFVTQTGSLFDRFLDLSTDEDEHHEPSHLDKVIAELRHGLDEIKALGKASPRVSLGEFVAAFRRMIDDLAVSTMSADKDGVQVLDAMAARGIPFRALLMIGLNEKMFPRHIHEDAFLRDELRRSFETDLGFKIPEKLAGYDEERLLFSLLGQSARSQLILIYQRADDEGRLLIPSSYLTEYKRAHSVDTEIAVPRRLTQKLDEGPQFRHELLTASEAVVKRLLNRQVPRGLVRSDLPAMNLLLRALPAVQAMDSVEPNLGPYDGITGMLNKFWAEIKTRGISPTSLEDYARCPFRYFSDHVLHLEPTTLPESVDTISPLDLGALVHDILEATLRTLREHGYFTEKPTTGPDPGAMLEEVARRSFDQYANTHSIGYPLVWECLQHSLVSTLLAIVREELESMSTEGWEPILFEHPMRGNLTLTLGPKSESLPVAGRPDRIDWHAPWNRYRIVDYKFKSSKRPDTIDSNLVLGAIRGQRLQPPLYLVMTQATLPSQRRQERSGQAPNCEGAWFHYVAPNWNHEDGRVLTREQFPADAWYTQLRAPLERVLSFLAGGIRSGMFFIQPGTYCGSCDYRLICRRSHQPSVCRARSDRVYVQPHRALRLTQPPQAKKATRSDRAASTGTLIQVTERGPQSGRDA